MKNTKEQQEAKRKLNKNFFREEMIRELDLQYRRQLSDSIKRGILRKKLSTH